ncbi:MAG: dUTP diphosphatase [Chthonomonas sp.]|nr:dUTP diphosphatase [Chthonomonas sp.]
MAPRVRVVATSDAVIPAYETSGAAGVDLRTTAKIRLEPGERTLAPTGLKMQIPAGYEGQIRPRSGLALKRGLSMVNSPGTIDSDYRGEIGIILINHGQETIELEAGERIAQMVFCPVTQVEFEAVESLDETSRGAGGFGSTGS